MIIFLIESLGLFCYSYIYFSFIAASDCGDDQYDCVDGAGICVARDALCDGSQDCLNVIDELGCGTSSTRTKSA